ncbi:MAG: hypothetical protein JF571_08245 [Asticcacaulis sp.]|nr:hypothetical protein [Asticcacaulis sp.]
MTERTTASAILPRIELKAVGDPAWSVLVVIVAAAIRLVAPLTNDTEWLITNARRFLDGAVLYRDIVETNPPVAILMHVPAALIERWTTVPAELLFTVMVFGGALASGLFFVATVKRVVPNVQFLLPVVLFVLLIAPLNGFDQREHVALILTLPLIGVVVLRAGGVKPPWAIIVLVGLLAGLAPMIKPYFALGIAVPYVALTVVRRRLVTLLAPEAVIAALLTVMSLAATWVLFPDYVRDVVPMLVALYRPMKQPLWQMVFSLPVLMWLFAVASLYVAVRKDLLSPFNLMLLSAAFGYLIGFIDQGRGWAYQMYPAVALLLVVVFASVPRALSGPESRARLATAAAAAAGSMILLYACVFGFAGCRVAGPIRAAVKNPTIMSVTWDLAPGHPITTMVHGQWVGTYSSRWVTVNAGYLGRKAHEPEQQKRYAAWLAYDRTVTNRDLAKRPDIVLVGIGSPFDWHGWIARDPGTAELMSAYVLLARDSLEPGQRGRLEGIEAWIRKDLVKSSARPARP